MYNFSHSDITGAIVFDTRRKKDNGLYPVKYRITFNRKQVYYKSGYDLSSNDWGAFENTKRRNLIEKRGLIVEGLLRIEDEIKRLVREEGFSFDALKRRLSKGRTDRLLDEFEKKVQSLIQEDRIGSAEYYSTTKKKIKSFSSSDTRFSEVTIDWLKRFEQWLIKDSKSFTTIGMYMRAIRAIMNEAKREGIINNNQYPFGDGKYMIPEGTGTKIALTLDQINKIATASLVSETEKKCRDIFYFQYLCNGINVNDLLRLKYSDIIDGEITWYRTKTIRRAKRKIKVSAVLLPEMDEIIKKWGNKNRKPDQYIFPYLHEGISPVDEKRIVKNVTNLINKKMKIVGKSLKIGNISTYVARHTYATVQKRGDSSIPYISESLGHADIKTTQIYLKSFEKETRLKNAAKLTESKNKDNC